MGAGASVWIRDRNDPSEKARVTNGRVHVTSVPGGGVSNVNITQVGGNPVTTTIPVEIVQMIDKLSASSNGLPIAVAATATPGTLIHTIPAGEKHRIFLTASQVTAGAQVSLVLEWGGTGVGNEVHFRMGPNNSFRVSAGEVIDNQTGGDIEIRAYATTTAVVNITGHVEKL